MDGTTNRDRFQKNLADFYTTRKRTMPWREAEADGSFDPYKILVSEIMLQQTQTGRVAPYFERFITAFPTISTLAASSLQDVLAVWQGLGYNRRARYLRDAATIIMERYEGSVPRTIEELISLPGVGKNTAGAILAYAYNQPEIFIETNIRTVYIHEFFSEYPASIDDKDITAMLKKTIDYDNPRQFYWALMDYGAELKSSGLSYNSRSRHYVKQSAFEGSARQLRGKVLRLLAEKQLSALELKNTLDDHRTDEVLLGLAEDKLIEQSGGRFFIAR